MSLRQAVGPAHTLEPVVDVWLRCVRCRHRESLHHNLVIDAQTELVEIRGGLEFETALPVFIDPPDDPPSGVREPRRLRPDGGAFTSQLDPISG